MGLNLRKLAVGLVVLGVCVLAYLVYLRLGGGIDLTVRDRLGTTMLPDSAMHYDSNVPRIGDVSVGTIRQTRFISRDDHGAVDREFGFDTLVHREGDQWEITKPYMRLFMSQFRCRVTADRGQVDVEMVLGRLVPGDATFSGNVVIHFVPNDPKDPLGMFIYLDDVAFMAERSLFSTAGPIKFVSRVAQLAGRGMELIYNESHNRLELFRIEQLESLRLRSADLGPLSNVTGRTVTPDDASTQPTEPNDADVVIVADDGAAALESDYYECVFWENVRIETPEQVIGARRRLAINNILWSEGNAAVPPDAGRGEAAAVSATLPEPNAPERIPYPGPNALDTTPSKHIALSMVPESAFDIVVTCDGGFVVGPAGIGAEALESSDPPTVTEDRQTAPRIAPDPNRQTMHAERIDVDAVTSDVVLAGPVQIGFTLDPNDLAGGDGGDSSMPVTVTARDVVRFVAATNQIHLEGDCMVITQQTVQRKDLLPLHQEYTLRAPVLVLDLAEDPNAAGGQIMLRHVTASGGPVSVNGVHETAEDIVGWVTLDGSRLDFDVIGRDFVVTGPGTISIHNVEAVEADAKADPNAMGLDRPCYALMSDFNKLTYSASAQRIVADSDERIQLGYLPLLDDGSYGPAVHADAGHIEVQLTETAAGRIELAALTASRGITYEDDTHRFAGGTLVYNHATGLVHVTGDAAQPCYFNGILVDEIEMNLSTGAVKTKLEGPGALQLH